MKPRRARYGAVRRIVHLALAGFLAMPAAAAGPLIWTYGDSLSAGYGLPPADGFPNRLEIALRQAGIPATVRNGSIAGDTAALGKARLRWGLRGLGTKPDLVLVELGANDMLRGLPPSATEQNLDAILAEFQSRRIHVLLIGMRAAPNLGADYRAAFEGLYPRLAKKYGERLYPFFLDGVAAQSGLLQADGRHPNAHGVGVIVKRILPVVREELAAQK